MPRAGRSLHRGISAPRSRATKDEKEITLSPDEGLAGSVPQSKRDDDIGRFGLVYFQTRPALVAPSGQIHDHGGFPRRLDRLNDVEPVAVEEERVFAEQIVELPKQGVAVGNGPGFQFPQSSLELCRVEVNCALLSFAPKRCALLRFAGPPTTSRQMRTAVVQMQSSVIPRGLRKLFSHMVKWTMAMAATIPPLICLRTNLFQVREPATVPG